jgi:hypothetical protein
MGEQYFVMNVEHEPQGPYGAIIRWDTHQDEPSDSRVEYGTDPSNLTLSERFDEGGVTRHRVELTGLQPGAQYYYRALSEREADGKISRSPLLRFYQPFTWRGFFRPVDNPPATNEVNAGSTVPVKFSLDGDQGLAIFAAGYPKSGGTTTEGSLSYDDREDQYTYTWRTDRAWSGQTRQLVVKLKDNSEHTANFRFR